jgi:hypothetical protein
MDKKFTRDNSRFCHGCWSICFLNQFQRNGDKYVSRCKQCQRKYLTDDILTIRKNNYNSRVMNEILDIINQEFPDRMDDIKQLLESDEHKDKNLIDKNRLLRRKLKDLREYPGLII